MEYGDASGHRLLNVRNGNGPARSSTPSIRLAEETAAADPERPARRPPRRPRRATRPEPGILVSAGGGDNMMGAIGTGNTREGVITAASARAGRFYAGFERTGRGPVGEIARSSDSTNRWLPLLCTMNATVATEMVRLDFGWSHEKFAGETARVPAGSNGCCCCRISKANARRTFPTAPASGFGVSQRTFEAGHFARAAMEGVTLGMNYGLRRLAELGLKPRQIRATGGGAKSKVWRQIMADVFNAEVVTLKISEGAAYGAAVAGALVLAVCNKVKNFHQRDHRPIRELNRNETRHAERGEREGYRELQELQDDFVEVTARCVRQHRAFVSR